VALRSDGTRRIARPADPAKDQSYVLHMLGQDQLSGLELPIGDLTKDEVRQRAASLGLRIAGKPDSQDVCFITREHGRGDFLARRIPLTPGRVVDVTGAEVGRVDAIELVTVGQRKGMELAGAAEPRYAVAVDMPAATVTVGSADASPRSPSTYISRIWRAGGSASSCFTSCPVVFASVKWCASSSPMRNRSRSLSRR
jgi:tRNA-specific 2-thiouridylase